ncbi:hydroperoxide reductase [Anaeramoeba flamelloides]|uniref:Hydroperoxide reductase n=1 Tax=Anaeramoeba flamelloides TaxID=1746091 RepID=A0ABQ8XQW7_9EUKA|nr:hydroperoxide reductase [Anaeramoeba flamelloides]
MSDQNSDAENFFSDLSDDSTSQSQTTSSINQRSSVSTSSSHISKKVGYDMVLDLIKSISETSEEANEEIKNKIQKDCKEISKVLKTIKEEILVKTTKLQNEKNQIKVDSETKLKKYRKKSKKKENEFKEVAHLKEELFRENTRLRKKLKEYISDEQVKEVAKNIQQFWINHINVAKTRQTLEEKKNLVKRESLHLKWFFNKRHQFETVLFHSRDKLTLKADTPKEIGGHGTAPTPIEMIAFSIGSQFCHTFVNICSFRGLKLKELYVESIIQTNMKRILGIEENEPLVTMIKITLACKTDAKKSKVVQACKDAEKICPMIHYIKGTIHCKTDVSEKKPMKFQSRSENNKHILNNIYLKNLKKYHRKIKKQGIKAELKSSVVHGAWDCTSNLKTSQFKAIINYSKRESDIWETDTLPEFGGTFNAPTNFQMFLAGLGSCYMSQVALAATMNNVKLDELCLDCSLDVDYAKFITENVELDENKNNQCFDNLDFKFKILSNCDSKLLKKIEKQGANKCLGIFISRNSVPISVNIHVNEKLDEKYLLDSKKESCDIM